MKKDKVALLICRDLGHDWEEEFPDGKRRAPWGIRRVLVCRNGCGTSRTEIIDIRGEVSSRHYDYDACYQEVTGYSKTDARAERMRAIAPKRSRA